MITTTTTPAVLDTRAARRLTSEIRNALAVADDLLAQAYAGRAWEALGHADWSTYCAAELPELRHVKLRAPERRARVAKLAELGASVREIAAATGASVGTVHGDLAGSGAAGAGIGGPGCAPAVGSRTAPADLTGRIVQLLAAHPGGLDVFAIARRLKVRQAQAAPALSRLARSGRIGYAAPARRGLTGTYLVQGDPS